MAEREIQLTFSARETTDADLCARWARDALSDGRYQLAAELVDLAKRAAAAHDGTAALLARTRAVPLIGETRQEIPARSDGQRSHAPQACAYRIAGVPDFEARCGQPIRWSGDAMAGGWYHLDPEITDHEPELP